MTNCWSILGLTISILINPAIGRTCDFWSCNKNEPIKKSCADSWDCSKSGGSSSSNFWKSRVPQISFADLAELKCYSLPYKVYFDRKQLICVSYRPISESSCEKIFGIVGSKTFSASLNNKLQTLKMLGDQTTTMNCVYQFRGDCGTNTNADIVEDRCIEVVLTSDTLNNAATYCQKKGFALFVPHFDKDLQLLLRYLLTTSNKVPAYWLGQAASGDLWVLHDNTTADYFRWSATRKFLTVAQGGQFVYLPRNNSYIGYIDIAAVTDKAPYICARYRNSDYTVVYTNFMDTNGGGGANTGGGKKCFDSWDCSDKAKPSYDWSWDCSDSSAPALLPKSSV